MNNLSKHFSKLVLVFGVILLFLAVVKNIPNYISNYNFQDSAQEERLPFQEETTKNEDLEEKSFDDEQMAQEVDSIVFQIEEDNQNAFELLKENAEIEYKEYDFGVFVESINGKVGDDKHFWALYVNGEQSMTGADQTTVNTGDTVEWRYTEVNQ